jgi:hypothetical protein
LRRAGRILATKNSTSCERQPEGKREDGAAESRGRNSDGFIFNIWTPVISLMRDSNSDNAKAATANYANRQSQFPDAESPIRT